MSLSLKNISVAFLIVNIAACSGKEDKNFSHVNKPEPFVPEMLLGLWEQTCSNSDDETISSQRTLYFEDDSFRIETKIYDGVDCTVLSYSEVSLGSYQLEPSIVVVETYNLNGTEYRHESAVSPLKFHIDQTEIMAGTDKVSENLNQKSHCASNTWKAMEKQVFQEPSCRLPFLTSRFF